MDDKNEDSSEIHTDYDSSPMVNSEDRIQYLGDDALEIEMYATDFENFLEMRQDEVEIVKILSRKNSLSIHNDSEEENPAEVIF